MALDYANMKVIHAGPQSSAVAFLAYMKRCQLVDEVTGQAYDFTGQHAGGEDLLADGVELPDGSPEAWRDPARLVNDMQKAELIRDRKTGEVRYRKGAQLARAETLAMPRELGLDEWKGMLVDFVRETYTSRGVPVVWAIHDASGDQPHAHPLISTRYVDVEAGKLGRKARELNPEFAKGVLVRTIRDFDGPRFRNRGHVLEGSSSSSSREGRSRRSGAARGASWTVPPRPWTRPMMPMRRTWRR